MSTLTKRLDKLYTDIQKDDFLEGKGLSNEVNIHIFPYDAEDEMIVRRFTENLTEDKSLNCHLIHYDLYRVFLSICDEKRVTNQVTALAEKKGNDFVLKNLKKMANNKAFVEMMRRTPHGSGDVILITGVGEAFPFIRVHSLLEAMQPFFNDVPIVVLYPGAYNSTELKLFDRLPANAYYRAFNIF